MITQKLWQQVNAELAAKTLGECSYEECLQPKVLGEGCYALRLRSGVRYTFSAKPTIWTWLRIAPKTLLRNGKAVESAVQLLIDAQQELAVDDITLGVLIEELHNTLFSECRRRQRLAGRTARELVALPGPQLQSLIDGHPKILANKGRMGWGVDDLQRYAPESATPFQLHYIAVHRDCAQLSMRESESSASLLEHCLDETALGELQARMSEKQLDGQHYLIMPVHPWQWQRFIQVQYASYLASGELVDMGRLGDAFLPQQSIRTLSNVSRPDCCDIKLSLTILNTSCYRGVPGEYIAAGVAVSDWLRSIIGKDAFLNDCGLTVMSEIAGVHCPQPLQKQIAGSPYRYREMLGAVWRESVESHLDTGEQGILLSTLMQVDADGRALLAEYVAMSGLSSEQWVRQLFDVVVAPLYWLMAIYGVGLVAHGQNIGIILRRGLPRRAVIKDFHGDLRLVDRDFSQLDSLDRKTFATLTRLPPEYLIHDLVTANFVTTLRFISPLAEEQLGLLETRFYALLAESLASVVRAHPQWRERFELFPLFDSAILKVCVNRVRFRIGYADHAERPLPELGSPISNPLVQGA